MTSFSFGQVGGVVVTIHPCYLWGTIKPSAYTRYRDLNHSWVLTSSSSHSALPKKVLRLVGQKYVAIHPIYDEKYMRMTRHLTHKIGSVRDLEPKRIRSAKSNLHGFPMSDSCESLAGIRTCGYITTVFIVSRLRKDLAKNFVVLTNFENSAQQKWKGVYMNKLHYREFSAR